MLIRHAPCFSKSVGLGKKRIEPVVQKTYQTLDPSLKLKVTQLLQKCRIAKKHNKISPRMWKLSVCLSRLLARVAIFACVTFLMNCHVTRQVTWFPRNLQRAFDPTGALCPTLPYWPFLWGIHRSPVNSPHKGQCRGALMFSLSAPD